MNVGGGEAADQTVRMMLTGCEVAVRLSGSALKNTLALTMALARNHKTISGKVNKRCPPIYHDTGAVPAVQKTSGKAKALVFCHPRSRRARKSDRRDSTSDGDRPGQSDFRANHVPPGYGKIRRERTGGAIKKRHSVGTRLARYQRQIEELQRSTDWDDDF